MSATLKTLHVECEKDDKIIKTYIPCFSGTEKNRVYVKTQLAPILRKGNVVVCDNLNLHKNKIARQMIEAKASSEKCEAVFG